MNSDPEPTATPTDPAKHPRRNLRIAIAFGVSMATIEMGILLYFAYC